MKKEKPITAEKTKSKYSHLTIEIVNNTPIIIKDYHISLNSKIQNKSITGTDLEYLTSIGENWLKSKFTITNCKLIKSVIDLFLKGKIKNVVELTSCPVDYKLAKNYHIKIPNYVSYKIIKCNCIDKFELILTRTVYYDLI